MDSLSSSVSPQNILRRIQNPGISLHSCRNANTINDTQLGKNVTHALISAAQIKDIIKNPMVRLFSGENLTEDSVNYHSGHSRRRNDDNKGCHDIIESKIFKSAETFGTCVRLFNEWNCKGLSLAIYGRSGNSHITKDAIINSVKSVGPCLEDEFINGTVIDGVAGHVVKDEISNFYPDLLLFGGLEWKGTLVFKRKGAPNIEYGLGPQNRIEYIRADIEQVGPAKIPEVFEVEATEFHKSVDKKDEDVPCYAVPLAFNGPANESINIFPTSQSKAHVWARLFPLPPSDPNEVLEFSMELHFTYENVSSTRPKFVYYHFYSSSDSHIYYGRFNNL